MMPEKSLFEMSVISMGFIEFILRLLHCKHRQHCSVLNVTPVVLSSPWK